MAPGAVLRAFPTTGNDVRPDKDIFRFLPVFDSLRTPGRRLPLPRENAFTLSRRLLLLNGLALVVGNCQM